MSELTQVELYYNAPPNMRINHRPYIWSDVPRPGDEIGWTDSQTGNEETGIVAKLRWREGQEYTTFTAGKVLIFVEPCN